MTDNVGSTGLEWTGHGLESRKKRFLYFPSDRCTQFSTHIMSVSTSPSYTQGMVSNSVYIAI